MAILWQDTIKHTHYEVRSAGASRRLYTDSVFHSQWNPNNPVTTNVWSLLTLPVFFYPANEIKRVLVLGVGGGKVINILKSLVKPEKITGVELNPVHIKVAERYFMIKSNNVELIRADAVTWLKQYRGKPFDVIIEDLFGECNGEPIRAIELNREWMQCLNRHLSPRGMLVVNTLGGKELKQCAYFSHGPIARSFKTAYRFSCPLYENVIGVFLKNQASLGEFRKNLGLYPNIKLRNALARLDYSVYKMSTSF